MMGVDKSMSSVEDISESYLASVLDRDWRLLYPLRVRHLRQIHRALERLPGERLDPRAAFGLVAPEQASSWLYRDFYLETPPPERGVDRAIGRLRRGNPHELLDLLGTGSLPEHVFRRVWYEVSTLVGRVLGTVVVERDGVCRAGTFEVMPRPSALPGRTINDAKITERIQRALKNSIGIEPHRQNVLQSLGDLLAGNLAMAESDNNLALLMHHTELTLSTPVSWSRLGTRERKVVRCEVSALQQALSSPPAFLAHLRAGLSSPWRQRRFLCYRLLRLDGHLDATSHPDDFMIAR